MQRFRKWSTPVLVGLWTLVLAHAAIPHVHAGQEARGCCSHDRVQDVGWVDAVWGWMHDWVHHHEESTVCDNLEDIFVGSPELQIFGIQSPPCDVNVKVPEVLQVSDAVPVHPPIAAVDPGHSRQNGKRGP